MYVGNNLICIFLVSSLIVRRFERFLAGRAERCSVYSAVQYFKAVFELII